MSAIVRMTDAEVMAWAQGIAALVRDTTGWTSELAWAVRRAVQNIGHADERDARVLWDNYCRYLETFGEGDRSLTAPEYIWRWLKDHPDAAADGAGPAPYGAMP